MSLVVGSRLGRYEVIGEIGQGGMSVVYRARDLQLERDVAIKVMHTFLAEQPEARVRFHREAVAVARLHHPNIIEIFDYSEENTDTTYIVTELVEGQPLVKLLRNGPITPPEAGLVLMRPIADALRAAHAAGVIHRDLKPENILVSSAGVLKLTDFGIARILDDQTLTMTGTLLGSPAYMAPEYIEGHNPDARADIFSFGAMLYQIVIGQLPFSGPTPHALLKKIVTGDYVPPDQANPAVHPRLTRLLRCCLALDPDARYANSQALLDEIDSFLAMLNIEPEAARIALLKDPAAYSSDLIATLDATYFRLGKVALALGDTGVAVEHFDRVLSLVPNHKEVRRILNRLSRRTLLMRGVRSVGLGLVGGLALAYGIATWMMSQPAQPAVPAPAPAAEMSPASAAPWAVVPTNKPTPPELSTPTPTSVTTPAAPAAPSTPPKKAPAPAVKIRDVEIKPAGQWVTLHVDDNPEPVIKEEMRVFHVSLSLGKHRLRFTNDKAQPLEQEVTVSDTEPVQILVRLRPLDAKLRIDGAPDGAVVEVAERRFVLNEHTRGDPIFVPLPEGQGAKEYEVVVHSQDGTQEFLRQHVLFRPGEEQTLAVAPKPL